MRSESSTYCTQLIIINLKQKKMKIKHLFLGLAMVALMAACTKNAETTSPTEATPTEEPAAAEVTPAEEQVEEPVKEEAPVKKETAKETKKETVKPATPKVDPCEAKVKAFEKFVDDLVAAKDKKGTVAGAKAYSALVGQVSSQRASVKECGAGEFKTRVSNAQARLVRATN